MWPCPHCKQGVLAIVPSSLSKKETKESKLGRGYDDWDPDWISYVFNAWLKCSHPSCGEEVIVAGKGSVERTQSCDEEGNFEEDWEDRFQPLFCWPMPEIFVLPEKCPTEVKSELCAAFRLFWSDQAASAGRVRVSLERLMDHYRIPKRRKGQNHKYFDLKLHDRIETFSQKRSGAGEKLMALKWLGNTASHQGTVGRDDILNGFEILEFLLAELFEQRSVRIEELTRQLTKKHAPHRAKTRKSNSP
jgi:hypothetical protein